MVKLEDIKENTNLKGIEGSDAVRVEAVRKIGDDAVSVTYWNSQGEIRNQMLHRSDEARIELADVGRPWSFAANGAEFKLGLEAQRIRLSHLFDPMMAVHTSNVEPLPHQISAVYETMLPQQPLRFVLADDPGAGDRTN